MLVKFAYFAQNADAQNLNSFKYQNFKNIRNVFNWAEGKVSFMFGPIIKIVKLFFNFHKNIYRYLEN